MFTNEELQLIVQVLNQVGWKTGQSKLIKIAEDIIMKISKLENDNTVNKNKEKKVDKSNEL